MVAAPPGIGVSTTLSPDTCRAVSVEAPGFSSCSPTVLAPTTVGGEEGRSAWAIPTDSKQPDLAYELIRYCLSNPDLLPTTGVMGSAFVGRRSFHKWGCYDAPLEKEEHFPWWPGLHEWSPIWQKWMEPIFVEGKPGVEAALEGCHKETQAFLDEGWWRD